MHGKKSGCSGVKRKLKVEATRRSFLFFVHSRSTLSCNIHLGFDIHLLFTVTIEIPGVLDSTIAFLGFFRLGGVLWHNKHLAENLNHKIFS